MSSFRGPTIFEQGATLDFGSRNTGARLMRFGFKAGFVSLVSFVWYNRKTNLEGGMQMRTPVQYLQTVDRLMDWYCHMLGSEIGYKVGIQYQCKLPFGKEPSTEEILNEFARGFMLSKFRYFDARERGLDEPLDIITKEQVESCNFLPPSEYGYDEVSEKNVEKIEIKKSSWWPFSKTPSEPSAPIQSYPGDVIGGYFVHRRCGEENIAARRRIGGRTTTELGGRSLVIAPDPWEGRVYILSATSGRGYCNLRMHYVCCCYFFFFLKKIFFLNIQKIKKKKKNRLFHKTLDSFLMKTT